MAKQAKDVFYVALRHKDSIFTGLRISNDPSDFKDTGKKEAGKKPKAKEAVSTAKAKSIFQSVIDDYTRSLETYRKFMPLTVRLAPSISYQVTTSELETFSQAKGKRRSDLDGPDYKVYQLGIESYAEFQIKRRRIRAIRSGAKHLPEVMLIGLISVYDVYFGALLRAVADKEAKIFLTDDKTIKLSDLNTYASIDEAKESLIQSELDSVLRSSLSDQLDWCQKHFKFEPPLKSYLPHWSELVEICERRNLFAHTGGIVSTQYIRSCKKAGIKSQCKLGERIAVDSKYFVRSVNVVSEVGMKLGHIFWRTFAKEEAAIADDALNSFCYDLILEPNYELAYEILKFGVEAKKKPANEELRRMLLVNYANCLRLLDRQPEADAILDGEDWSACGPKFRVSVAAVKNDLKGVIKIMEEIGAHGEVGAEEYRGWPVFSRLQGEKVFQDAFKKIFKEPLIRFEVSPPQEEPKLGRQSTETQKLSRKSKTKKAKPLSSESIH